MPALFNPKKISPVLGSKKDPQHPMRKYMVGDEEVIVEPGTLLWFNNKIMHGTENIGDCIRITFVFDVPHSKWNP